MNSLSKDENETSKASIRASLSVLSSESKPVTTHQTASGKRNKWLYLVVITLQFMFILLLSYRFFFELNSSVNEQNNADQMQAIPQANAKEDVRVSENRTSHILIASGMLKAKQVSTVSSEITAKLKEIVVIEGEMVKKGDIIAVLDDELIRYDVAIAKHNLNIERDKLTAKEARLNFIIQDVNRTLALWKQKSISERAYRDIQTTMKELRADIKVSKSFVGVAQDSLERKEIELIKTKIPAPFDGVVASLNASEGEIVSPISNGGFTRTGIVTIVSSNRIFAEVWIPERSISKIKIGQEAELSLDAWPSENLVGKVNYISPVIDRQRAALVVHIEISNPSVPLVHEMNLEAKFKNFSSEGSSNENK